MGGRTKTTFQVGHKPYGRALGGYTQSEKTREKIREKAIGRVSSLETRKRISESNKGKHFHPHSEKTRQKISEAHKCKMLGANNPSWKGGTTLQFRFLRKSNQYKLWRDAILKRDNYTCIWCGLKEGLEADHIKPFAYFPELRFAIDNGRTLCHSCHRKTHTYGKKK